MKNLPLLLSPSRTGWIAATFFAVVISGWLVTPSGFSQAPNAMTNNSVLTPMLTKLKSQQDQMAANQTKIEAQTAQLKEEIRLAKIYTGRSR